MVETPDERVERVVAGVESAVEALGSKGGETGDVEDEGKAPSATKDYITYKQRWAILITVTLLNISNASLWINTAPVTFKAAAYFQQPVEEINWFSLVFLFVSIPFCFISTFSVNHLGLRPAIHIGSALNCLGAVLRAVSTSGLITSLNTQFAVSLTGQTIAGMAQPFLLFIPTKVSQLWFPEHARAISTTVLSMSNPLGILVAQVSSPLLVKNKDQLPTLNYVFCGVAIVSQVVTLACITRSKPPTPPSQSAERGEKERAPYLTQLKQTFTNVPYLLLLLSLGCGVGLFSSLATVTQQLLCPLGYSDTFSGLINGAMIFCGFVGSAVTGIMADRTKAFTPITKVTYGLATVLAIILMEMFMVPHQHALVALFMGLFGFFGVGAYPIGLELAVETTYPVEESISTAFIFMSGQAQGMIIIAMVTFLAREEKPEYSDLEVCTKGISSDSMESEPQDYTVSLMAIMGLLTFAVTLTIVFFHTPYKRLEAERASTSLTTSTSSVHSLTATSGYASENICGTDSSTSSRNSEKRKTVGVVEEWEAEDYDPEIEQSHL
ncbi:solute carrier family 49 member A3-like [Homarus americanus]|uniref:solute carrier family 49 member A3-like n=1 Tax=Homarus americanus TaxID=6706 RepID=UPI001C464614|nr:solute carrier family 49 member A3-like [Homarus americanus]